MSKSYLRAFTKAAILLASALSAPALAMDGPAYPVSTSGGENSSIEYGPGPRGAVVGGGRTVTVGTGEDARIVHLDPEYTQRPMSDLVPMSVGSGENSSIVYVPAQTHSSGLRRAPRG